MECVNDKNMVWTCDHCGYKKEGRRMPPLPNRLPPKGWFTIHGADTTNDIEFCSRWCLAEYVRGWPTGRDISEARAKLSTPADAGREEQ